jgi:hypothetical protein
MPAAGTVSLDHEQWRNRFERSVLRYNKPLRIEKAVGADVRHPR